MRRGISIGPSGACENLELTDNTIENGDSPGSSALRLAPNGGNWENVRVSGNVFVRHTNSPNGASVVITRAQRESITDLAFTGNSVRVGEGQVAISETAAVVGRGMFSGNLIDGAVTLVGAWDMMPDNLLASSSIDVGGLSRVADTTPVQIEPNDNTVIVRLARRVPAEVHLPAHPRVGRLYRIKDGT